MSRDKLYSGIVQKVIEEGEHGPYAVASVDQVGLVTFSLNQPVWQESDWPEGGSVVLLSEVRQKRAGWRAYSARFVTPADSISTSTRREKRA